MCTSPYRPDFLHTPLGLFSILNLLKKSLTHRQERNQELCLKLEHRNTCWCKQLGTQTCSLIHTSNNCLKTTGFLLALQTVQATWYGPVRDSSTLIHWKKIIKATLPLLHWNYLQNSFQLGNAYSVFLRVITTSQFPYPSIYISAYLPAPAQLDWSQKH